jgi:uncharacterized protein YbjT (DUF2867 family)
VRVCVIGATGFTGSHVLGVLRARGIQARCLVRSLAKLPAELQHGIEVVPGSIEDSDALRRAMSGVDVLLTIASLGFGHAPALIDTACAVGVPRAVFVSTTSIFTRLNPPSKKIRLEAEELIRASGLAYTILRPTMIYGTHADRNMARLIRFIHRSPIVPIAGSGQYLQQPVYVVDVANAVVDAAVSDAAVGRSYNIPGRDVLTYVQIVDTIAAKLDRRVLKVHLPLQPVAKSFEIVEHLGLRLPLKSEQFLRLNEDKVFDPQPALDDFGYLPIPFHEGIEREIREMKLRH